LGQWSGLAKNTDRDLPTDGAKWAYSCRLWRVWRSLASGVTQTSCRALFPPSRRLTDRKWVETVAFRNDP